MIPVCSWYYWMSWPVVRSSLTFTRHFEFRPHTNPAQLFRFSWMFWALIIALHIPPILQASGWHAAVVPTTSLWVHSKMPWKRTLQCVFLRSSVTDEFLSQRYPDIIVIRKDSERAMFDALRLRWYNSNQGCGAVITIKSTFETYCNNKVVNWDRSLTTKTVWSKHCPPGLPPHSMPVFIVRLSSVPYWICTWPKWSTMDSLRRRMKITFARHPPQIALGMTTLPKSLPRINIFYQWKIWQEYSLFTGAPWLWLWYTRRIIDGGRKMSSEETPYCRHKLISWCQRDNLYIQFTP